MEKSPQKRRLYRTNKMTDAPENIMTAQPAGPILPVLRALLRLYMRLRAALRGAIRKRRYAPHATHRRRSPRATLRVRVAAIAGCGAVIIAALLLVLFAPGGTAAPASGPPSDSQAAAVISTSSPLPTTEPDPDVVPIPTTEPDPIAAQTPAPTRQPTSTPAPTQRPTATSTPSVSSGVDMNTLLDFYRVDAPTYYSDYGFSSNHYEYTDEELIMLAQVIQREAGGECDEGKIAVGNVVINRVLCGHWGSTIADQLGGLAYNPDIQPRQSCLNVARAVLDDEVWVVPQSTYNFKNSGGEWRSFTFWGQIGNQYFYMYHYGNRYTGTAIPPALYKRVYKYAQYGCEPAERVSRIQYMLQSLGYHVTPDRYFGESTKAALIAFQQDHGLSADGVAGPATVEALIRAFGVDKYCEKYS